MAQVSCNTFFMRGGTSKGLFFHAHDLPADRDQRDRFILRAMGSPDPFGRQLDGMGGGISSLSKAVIVSSSAREGVDLEYQFGQVGVDDERVDYDGNCGNLSSAVGVFAVESGLVSPSDGEATLRMFNLNSAKRVDLELQVRDGHAAVEGDLAIAGVAGTGAPIRLDFVQPGGSGTGRLLPTDKPVEPLDLPDGTTITASIVDAAIPCVFVRAADMGLVGIETPSELRNRLDIMTRLEAIRSAAALKAGIVDNLRDATRFSPATPKVAMVAPAAPSPTLAGERLGVDDCDIQVRMISMGAPHLAIPLTGAMCVGVAARIPDTLVQECARSVAPGADFRIGHGSGVLPVSADVRRDARGVEVERVSVYRTARVLMAGRVFAPAS